MPKIYNYVFAGWMDEDGKLYEKDSMLKGSYSSFHIYARFTDPEDPAKIYKPPEADYSIFETSNPDDPTKPDNPNNPDNPDNPNNPDTPDNPDKPGNSGSGSIAFTLLIPSVAKGQVDRIRHEIRSLEFLPSRNPVVDWEPWKSRF